MAATRDRHFRCNEDLWAAAREAAAAEGRTVTDVLVAALRRLVASTEWWTDPGSCRPGGEDAAAADLERRRLALRLLRDGQIVTLATKPATDRE